VENDKFTPGQHYKLQLYYKTKDNVASIFSNAGVFKYIQAPELKLNDYSDEAQVFTFTNINTGYYYNLDTTEKVYSYEFILKHNNEIIETSGI
jgi:hypothetical protein